MRPRQPVYHGLPRDSLALHPAGGDEFAFLGRVSPEKGLHDAIAIADAVGLPLRIAAKVPPEDDAYFARCVGPRLSDGRVDYDDVFDGVWPNLFAPSPLVQLTAPATLPALLEPTDLVLDENLLWAIELMWFDELYGTSSDSEEDEEDALEATAVDGVFAVYDED